MRVDSKVNVITTINRHILEVRFTSTGKRLAVWYDDTRSVHFEVWKDGIIDALCDLTEGENDVRITVTGLVRRKENRTEFQVDAWHLTEPNGRHTRLHVVPMGGDTE